MNGENDILDLKKSFQDAKIVDSIGDMSLLEKNKVWTIVKVKDRGCKPYILLGEDDNTDSKFWFSYTGESKEDLEKFYQWKKKSDEMMQSKKRAPEELDYLKSVMLSYGILSNLINEEEFSEEIFKLVLSKLAAKWYIKDNPDKSIDNVSDDEITVYCSLVFTHIKILSSLFSDVIGSVTSEDGPTISGD